MSILIFSSTINITLSSEESLKEEFKDKCRELSKQAKDLIKELQQSYFTLPISEISEEDQVKKRETINKFHNLSKEMKEFIKEIEIKYNKEEFLLTEEFAELSNTFFYLANLLFLNQ